MYKFTPYLPGKIRLLLLLVVLTMGACSGNQTQSVTPSSPEISKEYKRGPVTMKLMVSKEQITIAEHLKFKLEVEAQEEYTVRLPEFGERLEQFGIVDYQSSSPRLTADGLVQTGKSYVLEPFLSGEYTIPAMKVVFQKKDEDKAHTLESEPITITVTSLLAENTENLTIKKIVPPGELTGTQKIVFYVLIGAVIIIAAGILLGYFLWRRKGKKEIVQLVPAHELAYSELEKLLAEDLIKQGKIKQFYLRLSHIIRHYIENRFGLRAPERTTEEFLQDLQYTNELVPAHKELLQQFLRHCDMVKFAAHQATNDEIQKSFDSSKLFIAETLIQHVDENSSKMNRSSRRMNHAV